jgi:cell division protein FtsQ
MDKIIDIDDRVPARKRKRKIRTNIKFSVLITIFLLCIFCLLYFQSAYSKIQTIQLSGNVLLTAEEYEALYDFAKGDSIWGFKEKEVEQKLMKNEWIKSVKINRELLTTVRVTVEEWPKVAYISRNNTFYPMLENGYILEQEKSDIPIDAPIFLQFEDEKLRKKIVKQLAKLNPEVLALISQIKSAPTESDPYSIVLYMNDGYEVRAEISSFASKLNYYPSIIAQIEQNESFEKGIIDMEVGSYYRPFSGEYDSLSLDGLEEGQSTEEDGQSTEEGGQSSDEVEDNVGGGTDAE